MGQDRLKMKAGHRRRWAVMLINQQREEAYKARLESGELSASDPRPDDLEVIEFVPIAIGEKPASPFDLHADMFLAESQRLKWRIDLTLPFFKKTYDAVPDLRRDDPEWLAARLGIPLAARARLLTAIVKSEALYDAATSDTDEPLPRRGREKTLRSVNRAAEVLFKYREPVARRITGRAIADDDMLERLRALMVQKAGRVAKMKRPAGVYMERLAPRLRSADKHSDEDLIDWGLGQTDVIEFAEAPTTVSQTRTATDRRSPLSGLVRTFLPGDLGDCSDDELDTFAAELLAAGEAVDAALADLKAERRSRSAG